VFEVADRERPVVVEDAMNHELVSPYMARLLGLRSLIALQTSARSSYSAYLGERISTQIHFDNDASDDRTLIEIETEDRLGLLFVISQTFAELSLDISAARIVTERGAALGAPRRFHAEAIVVVSRGPLKCARSVPPRPGRRCAASRDSLCRGWIAIFRRP